MFVFATPIAFASLGGLYAERSGVVNIGLEGMMLSGCFFGILVADKAGTWVLGILAAMLSGAVLGLVNSFLAIHMRADQIVGGTAVNFLAVGITGYLFIQIYGSAGTPDLSSAESIPDVHLNFLGNGFFGQVLGWVLLTRAMPQLPASLIGLLLLLQPALSFVFDVILFARPTHALDWIGVVGELCALMT